MRVAFTSSDGLMVDRHFAAAESFYVWEVGPDSASFVEQNTVKSGPDADVDRISARANTLDGCNIVYTMQIGGPAAAKLVARRVQPMKTTNAVTIAHVIEQLQGVLRGSPPPWLRKLNGMAPQRAPTSSLEED